MEAGVYLISNNVNGKCYVGSTIHLNRRRLEHFSALANCKHVNAHLQNAYNKYGREVFDFEILEVVAIDGVVYNSLKEASEATGIKYNTIQKRLKNPKFNNYCYVKSNN